MRSIYETEEITCFFIQTQISSPLGRENREVEAGNESLSQKGDEKKKAGKFKAPRGGSSVGCLAF